MSFDNTDATDLAELKSEVAVDPTALGYAAVIAETDALLALINDPNPATLVSKPGINPASVRSQTTFDAYNNLSIDEQEWIRWMTGANAASNGSSLAVTVDLKARLTGPGNASIWAAADRDAMNAAMLALIDVPGSRAEILWGYGTNISRADWFAARDS
jgi:hypothetical protein